MPRKVPQVGGLGHGEGDKILDSTLVSDRFERPQRAGHVIGSRSPDGTARQGVDREGVISADNGAMRIAPLLQPGWGREGLAYGPFRRENGLAFAVFMLNGHNTAQSENLTETFRARLNRWFVGSEVYRRRHRLAQFLTSNRKLRTLRQWRWWRRISKEAPAVPLIDENLAVGWFPTPAPQDPVRGPASALVMHATGAENGELWARSGETAMPTVRGVQNLPVYYVVVLREFGAAYYASSVPDAHGLGCYPALRPIAIDPHGGDAELYAGLHQSTLGQIGFRLDTRVYGTRVARIAAWSDWYGTAIAADGLQGAGALDGSSAEQGGPWRVTRGGFARTAEGACTAADDSAALLDTPAPVGLVHVMLRCAADTPAFTLVWRHQDDGNHWRISIDGQGAVLACVEDGTAHPLERSTAVALKPGSAHSLQILDDGRLIGVHLDGQLVFGQRFADLRLAAAQQVGFAVRGPDRGLRISRLEAHPRSCDLPSTLDMGRPWYRLGQETVAHDDFSGPARNLDGRPTACGKAVWHRTIGEGNFLVTGEGSARIDATAKKPNPGRTAYTFDWTRPEFADLEVEITPAGTVMGEREHGLCGFVFWQDPDNYIALNLWRCDSYEGASISSFFQIDGYEDLYDAIWSNIGNQVYWGRPFRLRVVFDGMHYMAFVDGQPVLYRALTDVYADARRLKIHRVGLLANWEWGNDTGSRFRHFTARA